MLINHLGQGSEENRHKPKEEFSGQRVQFMQMLMDIEERVCISIYLESGVRLQHE